MPTPESAWLEIPLTVFDRSLMESRGYGIYEHLNPTMLPPLYIAYDPSRAEVSDVPH